MKSVLLYNLYLINHWQSITEELFESIPQDAIYVNIAYDLRFIYKLPYAKSFLKKNKKVKGIFFTPNNAKFGEVLGFEKFRKKIDYKKYNIATYIHSKGVSRPNHPYENDWRELMRYFVMERFDLTLEAFEKGYAMYGVNLYQFDAEKDQRNPVTQHSDFWYRGNFVSVNLDLIRESFLNTVIGPGFYAVEGFWGKLCTFDKAYSPHNSRISHYKHPYPKENYT